MYLSGTLFAMNKQRGTLLAATGAATAASLFIPVVGPVLGIGALWKATSPSGVNSTIEMITVSFNKEGIVSNVATSTQSF